VGGQLAEELGDDPALDRLGRRMIDLNTQTARAPRRRYGRLS